MDDDTIVEVVDNMENGMRIAYEHEIVLKV